jgi:putative transposase
LQPASCARHRFPPELIRHAMWLYLQFTQRDRKIEELQE